MKVWAVAVVLAIMAMGVFADCPVVTTQMPFNVTEYVRADWYMQMQMPVQYLPYPDEFYCCKAHYEQTGPDTISVNNLCDVGGVNQNPTGGPLCADIPDPTVPSKLEVGVCFLPRLFRGPYWVVAAGPSSDRYDWALISGGQPTIETPYGCKTGNGTNASGLWVASRTPVAPQDQVDMVVGIAKSKGFDVTVLKPVQQQGCTYQQDKFHTKKEFMP